MEIHVKIKRVAIYSRKSRPDETEDALQRQLQILIDMAVRNNWEWEVFQEVGSSMSIDERDRPKLNELLRRIKGYEFDGVLVTDADRLSRDIEHSAHIKKMFTNYGVKLITTSKVYDYSLQEDDLMSDMMAVIAKQEYVNTKKRLNRGRMAAAKEGRWLGRPPMGYVINHETGLLVIDETTAPLVRDIFKQYNDGVSSRIIAENLRNDGVLTPFGKEYCRGRIIEIIKTETYTGNTIYGKTTRSAIEKYPGGNPIPKPTDIETQIRVEQSHPAIISTDDWNKAQALRVARLKLPAAGRIGKKTLSGLIKCGLCGATLSFQRNQQNIIQVMSCRTKIYANDANYMNCRNQCIALSKIEDLFYNQLAKFIKSLGADLEYIKSGISEENLFNPEHELNEIKKKIKKIDAQMKKVQKAYLLEILTDAEAKEEIKLLRNQRNELEKEMTMLKETTPNDKIDAISRLVADLENIMTGTTEIPEQELNVLLRTIIERIEYTRFGKKGDPRNPFSIKIVYK